MYCIFIKREREIYEGSIYRKTFCRLRSEVQLTTATSTRVVEPQVIAIAIEDNKDAFRDNNYNNNSKKNNNQTNDIDDEEEKPVEPKKKSGSFVCCK